MPNACGVFYLLHCGRKQIRSRSLRSALATTNPRLVARAHKRALKELQLLQGRLALEAFSLAVDRSVAYRFRNSSPDPNTVSTYVESLNAGDLGLAVMCDAGDETAWEHLVLTYRPLLYRAASILASNDETGRELADSLWAELYGVGHTRSSVEPGGERRSLLRHFHGRSKLSTWFRSVLAQRHIDVVRSSRRTESLDADDTDEHGSRSSVGEPATVEATDPDHAHYAGLFQQALKDALKTLNPRDRLRLSYYYVQSLPLAQTGRLLKEHEATVSRKLARVRKQLRLEIEETMKERHRLTPGEIDLCYQYVVKEGSVDLDRMLRADS